jgi:hypothetical protein
MHLKYISAHFGISCFSTHVLLKFMFALQCINLRLQFMYL